jgi:hypothetical protein
MPDVTTEAMPEPGRAGGRISAADAALGADLFQHG